MLKVPVTSGKGVTRHRSFQSERAPPVCGEKKSVVSGPETVVPPQEGTLSGGRRTALSRHESFLSEKEKTFFRTKEPLLGKRVSEKHCFIGSFNISAILYT